MASPIQEKKNVEEQLHKLEPRVPIFAVEQMVNVNKEIAKVETDSKGVLVTFKEKATRDDMISIINGGPNIGKLGLPPIASSKFSFGLRIEDSDVKKFNAELVKKEAARTEEDLSSVLDQFEWTQGTSEYFKSKGVKAYSIEGRSALQMKDEVAAEFAKIGINLEKLGEHYYSLSGELSDVPKYMLIQRKSEEIPATAPQAAAPKEADLNELDKTTKQIADQVAEGKEVKASLKDRYYALVNKLIPMEGPGKWAEARGKRKTEEEFGYPIEKQELAMQYATKVRDLLKRRDQELAAATEAGRESGRKEVQDKYAAEMDDLKKRQADLEALVSKLAKGGKRAVPKPVPKTPPQRVSFTIESAPTRVEQPTVSDEIVNKNAKAILSLKTFSSPIIGVYTESSRSANGTLSASDSTKMRSLLLGDKIEKERTNTVISFTLTEEQQAAISGKVKGAELVPMRVKVIRNQAGQDAITVTRATQY
ncbi:Uncharacterised protein [uncultured archaeon]|nr:Uncharacterised protein [uncultured archaeon]